MSSILTASAPLVVTSTPMVDLSTADSVNLSDVVKGKNTIIGELSKCDQTKNRHRPPALQ